MPLTLVGGFHGDKRGLMRTLRFLQAFEPDLLLVELSPYGKAFRDRHQRTLQHTLAQNLTIAAMSRHLSLREALLHPEITAIRRQMVLPFEYRAARRYAQLTGNPVVLVDYSPFSRRMISHWRELLSIQNLSSLLTLDASRCAAAAATYDLAARAIQQAQTGPEDYLRSGGSSADPLWKQRERFMAGRIRAALKRFAPRRAVYLGGWQHLTTGGSCPSLRDLLELPQAPVYLLDRGYL